MFYPALLCSLLPLVVADTQLRLLHRVYHPLEPPVDFSERGSLLFSASGTAEFQPSENLAHDLQYFAQTLQSLDGALYQVALERKDAAAGGHWGFSSVKACHLPTHTEDHLIVHVTNAGHPFALDYFLLPVPHDGTCHKSVKHPDPLKFPMFSNTTVSLRSPKFPPLPTLRTPPPLTPQGAPVQPVPEKSFIQKYWVYLLAAGFALLMTGTVAEEEAPRRSD